MKRVLLLFSILTLSLYAGATLTNDEGWRTATVFNWQGGNPQNANTTVWYVVDLSQNVSSDENVMLYLNDTTNLNANVEVAIYKKGIKRQKNAAGEYEWVETDEVAPTFVEEQAKTITAGRNYAYEISRGTINQFSLKTLYVQLKTDQGLRFAAEPVEPGEKDIDCLNAEVLTLSETGTTKTCPVAANGKWYRIDVTAAKATGKTVKVVLKNANTTAQANVTAGVSFDCPSTGITEQTRVLKAGETLTKMMDRSYLEMMAGDEVYLKVITDQKLTVTATVVDDTTPVVSKNVGSPVIALDTLETYTLNGGTEQWYSLDLKKVGGKRQMPEITIENLSTTAKTTIEAELVYTDPYTSSITRTMTLAAGAVTVKEIERNVVSSAIQKLQEICNCTDTGSVYVRLTSTQNISFMARSKSRTEGTACKSAKEFDWKNGNTQMGGTILWYAINIKAAKDSALTANPKDIQLFVTNKSANDASISVQVATECPCSETSNASGTVKAGKVRDYTVKNSIYKALKTDTIWVGLTTSQNIEFTAQLVAAETTIIANICDKATELQFDSDDRISLQYGVTSEAVNDTAWYKFDTRTFLDGDSVPKVTVTNLGSSDATVTVLASFECQVTQWQKRTITVSDKYEKVPSLDLVNSVDTAVYKYIYIGVVANQQLSILVEPQVADAGSKCATAYTFDWVNGVDYEPAEDFWYVVDISEAKQDKRNVVIKLQNKDTKNSAKVNAEISFSCKSGEAPTAYSYTVAPGKTVRKTLTYSSIISTLKSDLIYIKIQSDYALHLSADTVADTTAVTYICRDMNPKEYDWVNGETLGAADGYDRWYKVALDTLKTNNSEFVPQLYIVNNGTAATTVFAEGSFECEAGQMDSRTLKLDAGQEYTKNPERSMMQNLTGDSIYFHVVSKGNQEIYFKILMISPDNGEDCTKAIEFDWVKGNITTIGDSTWYRVDISNVKANHQGLILHMDNNDGFAGSVFAEIFYEIGRAHV